MKTSEIKELLDNIHSHIDGNWDIDNGMASDCATAIETLLAREAEVLRKLKQMHTLSRDDNVNVALWNALDASRAILNPENENGN